MSNSRFSQCECLLPEIVFSVVLRKNRDTDTKRNEKQPFDDSCFAVEDCKEYR